MWPFGKKKEKVVELSATQQRVQEFARQFESEELDLVKTLARFPERVLAALGEYEPSVITRYILDLCAAFNRFYHECQILSAEDEATRKNRIAMVAATNTVLGRALHLICLKTPEKI